MTQPGVLWFKMTASILSSICIPINQEKGHRENMSALFLYHTQHIQKWGLSGLCALQIFELLHYKRYVSLFLAWISYETLRHFRERIDSRSVCYTHKERNQLPYSLLALIPEEKKLSLPSHFSKSWDIVAIKILTPLLTQLLAKIAFQSHCFVFLLTFLVIYHYIFYLVFAFSSRVFWW